jgi:hypothetical protein
MTACSVVRGIEINQATIKVFDPVRCCSTGVCGVDVDDQFVTFASDSPWFTAQAGALVGMNLGQKSIAFAEEPC